MAQDPSTDTGNPLQDYMAQQYGAQNKNLTGTTQNPVYKDNGSGGQQIDWGQTQTGAPQYGQGWVNDTGIVGPGGVGSNGSVSNTPSPFSGGNPADPGYITQQVTQWMQQNGITPGGRGSGQSDVAYWADRIGQTGGWQGDNIGYWQNLMKNNQGGDAAGGGGGGVGGGGGGFSMTSGSGIDPTKTNALFDLLMKRANTSLDVNPNDPIIKAQSDAYGAQTQNAEKNYEAQAAERGGTSYNPDATMRSMAEQGGQAQGAFQAQLMGQELTARRQEVEQALAQATALGETTQAQMLQEELAKLQLAQQESQFGRSLGQSAYQFDQQNMFQNSPLAGA